MRKLVILCLLAMSALLSAQKKGATDLFPEHSSQLNIPLTFSSYNELEANLHLGDNSHTAAKPFIYQNCLLYTSDAADD